MTGIISDSPSIDEVGFFHFGNVDHADPLGSLEAALREETKIRQLNRCVVVIPEAFNIACGYFANESVSPDVSMMRSLARLSCELRVAFVAGLIDEGRGNLGYSSAHFIDGDIDKVLSRKAEPDWHDPAAAKYKQCANPCDRVLLHRHVCVAALICKDGATNGLREPEPRQLALLKQIESAKQDSPALLCLPSRMTTYRTRDVAEEWASRSPDLAIVIANAARGLDNPSVIRLPGQKPICMEGEGAVVRFASLRD